MLEILKDDVVVATLHEGGRFHIPEQKLVIFNVTLDTEIPGHTVRQYVPPEPSEPSEPSNNPNDYPLKRWQFKAMVEYLGLSETIEAAIVSLFEDPLERAKVFARYRESDIYLRSDPLFDLIATEIGLSPEDLDAAWMTIATA